MFEQKFAFSLVELFFVHMRQFHFDFYSFSIFLNRIFFLNGFPNTLIVRSWSSFLFSQ